MGTNRSTQSVEVFSYREGHRDDFRSDNGCRYSTNVCRCCRIYRTVVGSQQRIDKYNVRRHVDKVRRSNI